MMQVPLIIRGEILDACDLKFEGRKGGVSFRTPDLKKHLKKLFAYSPAEMAAYQNISIEEIARFLDELSHMLDLDSNPSMQRAYELSCSTSGLSSSIIEWLYRNAPKRQFARDHVMEYAEKRIGIDVLQGWVDVPLNDGGVNSIRAFGARCVNVIAGNLPGVAISTVLRSAITRSDCITKTPSNDPLTMLALLETMIKLDPLHPVTRHMSAGYWKGGDESIESQLYHPDRIEKIIAWGGFDSIKHITRYLQPGLDLIAMDPKYSGSIIGRDAFKDEATMREVASRAAIDIGVYNQEACANARTLYVECDVDDADQIEKLNLLGRYTFEALQTLPSNLSTPAKYVVPALKEELDGLFFMDDFYKIYRDGDSNGAIVVSQTDEPVAFSALLACRTANFVPVKTLDDAVQRVNAYTQTIGVYPDEIKRTLRDALALRGGQMIVSLGYVARLSGLGPLDGLEPERRMLKWVVEQTPNKSVPGPWVAATT